MMNSLEVKKRLRLDFLYLIFSTGRQEPKCKRAGWDMAYHNTKYTVTFGSTECFTTLHYSTSFIPHGNVDYQVKHTLRR